MAVLLKIDQEIVYLSAERHRDTERQLQLRIIE